MVRGRCRALGLRAPPFHQHLPHPGHGPSHGRLFSQRPGRKGWMCACCPFPWELFRRLLGIGLPAGGEGLSYNLSQSTSLVFVNMIGTYAVTARMYMNMFAQICYMLVSAVSQAAAILIGYCIGAKELRGADRQNWRVLRFSAPVTVGTAPAAGPFCRASVWAVQQRPAGHCPGQAGDVGGGGSGSGPQPEHRACAQPSGGGRRKISGAAGRVCSQWAVGSASLIFWAFSWAGGWQASGPPSPWTKTWGILFVLRWKRGKWRGIKTV